VKKNDVRLGTLGGYDGDKEISQFCPSKQQIQQLESLYANKKNLDAYYQVPGTNRGTEVKSGEFFWGGRKLRLFSLNPTIRLTEQLHASFAFR
jgi:hypothetical protein